MPLVDYAKMPASGLRTEADANTRKNRFGPQPRWRKPGAEDKSLTAECKCMMIKLGRKRFGCAVLLAAATMLSGCGRPEQPLTLAPHVDLDRYSGRWFIIANIPYFAERGNVGSFFDITMKSDAKLTDVYTAKTPNFDAAPKSYTLSGYVVPDSGNARWRESPVWPIYLSYLILYVDPDYHYALVGYPGREYGWILSRQPEIDEPTYQTLLKHFQDQGYDASRFRRVPQTPAQIGRLGFE